MKIILQKLIAASGYSSRRQAEKLINEGRVHLNGKKAKPGDMADLAVDKITIGGEQIGEITEKTYIKLNKPVGYTCTNRRFPDEQNIFDLVHVPIRLFTIGRLDKDSRGLVILTNDGDLAQRLSHPKFEHEKVYEVRVSGQMKNSDHIINLLRQGIDIGEGDGLARVKHVSCIEMVTKTVHVGAYPTAGRLSVSRAQSRNARQETKDLQKGIFIITLSEGKRRQIRRMFKVLGLNVTDIRRVNLAGLEIGSLAEGRWEYMSPEEVSFLKEQATD